MQSTPQIPRIICIGFGLAGVAAYVLMALIDIHYGEATALTAAGKTFQPVTMAIVSAIGFLLVCGSGALYRSKRYTLAAILFGACGIYMGYSALNGIGFFAGETIGKVRQIQAKNNSLKEATDRANTETKEMRDKAMSWLTGTQIKTAKERERVEDKVIELATKPVEVKAAPVDAVIGDMRSEVMRKLLGVEIENAQIANSVWVVTLLVLGKLLGPSLMFALWPTPKVGPSLQENSPTFPSGSAQNWTLSPKELSKQEALLDLRRMFPTRTHQLTLPFLAAKWGLTPEGTRQRLKDWEARKLITLDKTKTDRGYALYVKAISPVLVASNADLKESA